MPKQLFAINPHLDRTRLAAWFKSDGRVQIRNVLTLETAREIREILGRGTRWGVTAQAGEQGKPVQVLAHAIGDDGGKAEIQHAAGAAYGAASRGDYGFYFGQYSLVQSVQENWAPGGPHEMLLEHLNAPDFLELVRDVTAIPELVKADGQATVFAPQNFLGWHIDSHVAEGWRIAYVLNLGLDDWKPDWGGYLNFFDDDGDIVQGYRPRFNALNLFAVPARHNVSYVPPFAPLGRFAITGWLRDR